MLEGLPRRLRLLFPALFLLSALVTMLLLPAPDRGWEDATEEGSGKDGDAEPAWDLAPVYRDFWFPDAEVDPLRSARGGPGFHPFRERMGAWSEEMVDRFWIPPRKIALEILTRKNDEHIRELFESIP